MQVASSRPFMGYDRTDFFIPSAGATISLMRPLPHMVPAQQIFMALPLSILQTPHPAAVAQHKARTASAVKQGANTSSLNMAYASKEAPQLQLRQQLSNFYRVYNPQHVGKVPAIVSDFVKRGGGVTELIELNSELRQVCRISIFFVCFFFPPLLSRHEITAGIRQRLARRSNASIMGCGWECFWRRWGWRSRVANCKHAITSFVDAASGTQKGRRTRG